MNTRADEIKAQQERDRTRGERRDLLRYASKLADDRHNPNQVLAIASTLTEWVDAAASPADRTDRFAALHRAYTNRQGVLVEPFGAVENFLSEADRYRQFLAGGPAAAA
jgi:hypothetical protein